MFNLNSKKKTILVEGNIGAGKTTFLQHMARYTNIQVVLEPMEKWTNCNGINLLQRMYEDPKKWSYTFQSYTMLTQFENHISVGDEKDIKFIERSVYSGRYCFAEALHMDGLIETESFQVYLKWFEFVENCIRNRTNLIVYLRTSPELAYDRIKKRQRLEEETIPFQYINRLHELHETWLYSSTGNNSRGSGNNTNTSNSQQNEIPIFILDANLPSHTIHSEYKRFEQFLHKSPLFNNITLVQK